MAMLGELGERFRRSGRMLPEGVVYHASWVDAAGTRCFQIMETANPQLLKAWISYWDDLVEFEIVPILFSSDFWARMQRETI